MRTTRMKSSLLIRGPVLFFLGLAALAASPVFPASASFPPSPSSSAFFPEPSPLPEALSSLLSSPSSGLSVLAALSAASPSFSASPFSVASFLALASPPSAASCASASAPSLAPPPELGTEPGKSASSFEESISHMCSSKKARISSLVSSPLSSPEMTPKRSSALPPFASMQTRSFAATSIRKASYSANAWCHAHCRTFATIPCAFTRRRFCMSALLLKEVSSCRIGSTSSGISETVFVMLCTRSCTVLSWAFTASTEASTTPAFSFSSSILS
mmetsp:Transcript_131684/g.367074  ORF Transcript_131684/g.367074 Transcript_131684/m.367074 type:complete len:273 (+) Transcript_131684:797-1615(+)